MSHNRDSLHTLNHRSNTLLQRIVDNTDTLEVSVDNLEVDMAGVETLLTTANNATLRDINNTDEIGDGSSNATSVVLGYDRSGGKGRALKVDASGNLDVNVVSMSGGGDASAANQTTMIGHLSTIEGDTTSLDSKVTVCNTGSVVVSSSALPTGGATSVLQGAGLPASLSTGSNLKVSIEEGQITGFATASNQSTANTSLATIAGDTTSLDGKIVACNTGSVVISSSALPTGSATSALQTTGNTSLATIAGDTTSLDSKITACDTGSVVISSSALPTGSATSALQTTGNTSLATIAGDTTSLDSKITACDTGSVVISSSALPTGSATSALQTTGNTSLATIAGDTTSLDGKVNQGYDSQIASGGNGLQQVLAYGRDSGGNLDALNVDNNGHLKVISAVVENKGSEGNVLSNSSLANSTATSSINVSDYNKLVYMYEDSNTLNSNGIRIEVSEDNSHFYVHSEFYPVVYGLVRQSVGNPGLDMNGVKYLRFNNHNTGASNDLTNVYISVLGTPN